MNQNFMTRPEAHPKPSNLFTGKKCFNFIKKTFFTNLVKTSIFQFLNLKLFPHNACYCFNEKITFSYKRKKNIGKSIFLINVKCHGRKYKYPNIYILYRIL